LYSVARLDSKKNRTIIRVGSSLKAIYFIHVKFSWLKFQIHRRAFNPFGVQIEIVVITACFKVLNGFRKCFKSFHHANLPEGKIFISRNKKLFSSVGKVKMRLIILSILILGIGSCKSSKGNTKVLKPKYHKVWAKGNKYLIDIPVGTRHIHLFERRRTKAVTMK